MRLLFGCGVVFGPVNTLAQTPNEFGQAGEATETIETIEEVRVVAGRLSAGIEGDFDPEVSYDQRSIRALAVSSLDELLQEIAPDLTSARGRFSGPPVVLVNGQRIASFREIRAFPPEALERVEIYAEDVALQYGYRADQKVVNFVLRPRFRANSARLSGGGSAAGGAEAFAADLGHLRILQGTRLHLNAELDRSPALHESDRDVGLLQAEQPASFSGNVYALPGSEIDSTLSALAGAEVRSATLPEDLSTFTLAGLLTSANDPLVQDDRAERTLLAERRAEILSASYALPVSEQVSATLSAEYSANQSDAELGFTQLSYLIPADHPLSPFDNDVSVIKAYQQVLQREQQSDSYEVNATLAGRWQGWSWTWLNRLNQFEREVSTDRGITADEFLDQVVAGDAQVDPLAGPTVLALQRERDTSEALDLSSRLLLRGVLFDGPQGPVQTSASVAWQSDQRDSETVLGNMISRNDLERDTRQLRFNLNTPLLETASGSKVSLNTNVELSDYSDFGNLNVLGAGLNWRVNPSVRLNASLTREEGPPEMAQLGDAISRAPNRRVFDFVNGRTENVTVVTGGNPALGADTRTVLNMGLQFEPFDQHDLSLTLNYVDSETDDPILSYPNPNAEIEAAFPARFVRDPAGQLVEFDSRPINLHNEQRRELRWGLRYSRVLRIDPERLRAERERAAARRPPVSDSARAERGRFLARRAARGGGGFGGRLRLALDHTYTLQDELTIAPGLAPIDYVGIGNAGRRRGGVEHEVTLRGSYSFRTWTARFNLRWQDDTRSLSGSTGQLTFSDLWFADLDLVYTFNPRAAWVRRYGLQFTRVKLSIDNLFDDQRRVEDQFGVTPLGLSDDEVDPRGRGVFLEIRKLFR